jgi:hypothetical protein
MKNLVWLASYPKSGNTWCRVFLANLINKSDEPVDLNKLSLGNIFSSRAIIEEQTGYDISELSADECDELRCFAFEKLSGNTIGDLFVKTHDAYIPTASGENMFPVNVTKVAIYFIRNPFDITLSFANHLAIDHESTAEKICDNNFVIAASKKKFNPQVRQKLLSWSEHVKSWTTQTDFPLLVVKYEDMLANPEKEFKKILHFLEIEYSEEKFNKALLLSSFENLKKMEMESGFKEKPSNCKSFFHVGKAGYYRNALSEKSINIIVKANSDTLIKYNYISVSGEIKI